MEINNKKIKTVCFTGHRPNKLGGFESNPIADWVKQSLKNVIKRAIKKGVHTFISGGAIGVDQWAAEIVIEFRTEQEKHFSTWSNTVDLIIAIPFPSQPLKWPQESRRHYEKLLQKADRIIEVCDDPYAAWKMQKRNEWMVDNSDAVIAVWNRTPGGTANCVSYALENKKPVLVLNPIKKTQKWKFHENKE